MQSPCYSWQILIKLNFLRGISKKYQLSNLMKILPMEAELSHRDGRTDGHDEANSRFL